MHTGTFMNQGKRSGAITAEYLQTEWGWKVVWSRKSTVALMTEYEEDCDYSYGRATLVDGKLADILLASADGIGHYKGRPESRQVFEKLANVFGLKRVVDKRPIATGCPAKCQDCGAVVGADQLTT